MLATKFGMDMDGANGPDWGARGSRRYVRLAVEASLRRLRTDWIDLYQYHAPDGITPIEETLAALDELVREGKVRYIGSSNLAAWQVADADWIARARRDQRGSSARRTSYSLLERGRSRTRARAGVRARTASGSCRTSRSRTGCSPASTAAASRRPTGTRLASRVDTVRDRTFDGSRRSRPTRDERGLTLLDVAIGGLAAQPAVGSVIAGATRPEQVQANAAAGTWEPTAEDLAALDAIAPRGTRVQRRATRPKSHARRFRRDYRRARCRRPLRPSAAATSCAASWPRGPPPACISPRISSSAGRCAVKVLGPGPGS